MLRPDQLVEKASTQAEGLRSLDPSLSASAPFSADQIASTAKSVSELNARQEAAKAAQHSLTKTLEVEVGRLNEMVSRNVAYFQGKMGKRDPRLPRLGGVVLVAGRRRKSGTDGQPKTT